jgi:fucose 4-O-acetylase-like acetyltransferase
MDFKPDISRFILCLCSFLALSMIFQYSINLNLRIYGHVIISTVEALLGIYLMLTICAWLVRFRWPSRVLTYMGQASLFILIFHYYLQHMIFRGIYYITTNPLLSGAIGFFGSIVGSSIILEVTKRNSWLRLLLLPRASYR